MKLTEVQKTILKSLSETSVSHWDLADSLGYDSSGVGGMQASVNALRRRKLVAVRWRRHIGMIRLTKEGLELKNKLLKEVA